MLCALLGFAAITFFNVFRMDKYGISFFQMIIYYIFFFSFLFAVSKLFFAIGKIPEEGLSFESFKENLIHGGIVFYGGLVGAMLGLVICTKILRRDLRSSFDFFTPDVPLFHCIARVGCMLSGCCYGKKWSWGIPNDDFPGVKLFPVQLIESVCNLIIFIAIIVYTKKRSSNKYCLEIYLVSYGVCRFILEFFRGDKIRGVWGDGLSTSQHISILMVLAVIIEAVILCGRNKKQNGEDDKNVI